MEKKNSLPVVMQFISDFVTADKSDLQQMNVEERTAALADILSKPVSSLPGTKIEKLCRTVKEFCSSNKSFRVFLKFPDLLTFDDLANYYADTKAVKVEVSRKRLIQLWEKETGASMQKLLPSSIESKEITRCLAIRICEMCEEITGRQILADCRTPMQYLGEGTTYNDIIDYFTVGSQKIHDIRCKIFKAAPEYIQAYLDIFRIEVLKAYALNCGWENLSDAELEAFGKKLVYECKTPASRAKTTGICPFGGLKTNWTFIFRQGLTGSNPKQPSATSLTLLFLPKRQNCRKNKYCSLQKKGRHFAALFYYTD